MKGVFSLRARLTVIILAPLILIASAVGYWQVLSAERTANDVFDRSLLTAALAVSRDVAVSDGDALSPVTAQLLENSSGGPVFYHVYAPDGVIVAGYVTPPVGIPRLGTELVKPQFFDAIYFGREVSGVRLQTQTEIEGFSGIFTTTVWQDRTLREAFVTDLVFRTLLGLGAVLASLAVIVWFGVRLGLRPLTDLEDAIKRRSSDDLSTIRRPVPEEVTGITHTLNGLFGQLQETLDAQSQFIANAAHQLRNPIAGILSLAEAAARAKTPEAMETRAADLLDAARKTSDLTQQLLLHERARNISPRDSFSDYDAGTVLQDWFRDFGRVLPDHIAFTSDIDAANLRLSMDETMMKEAVKNLVTNAALHGGPNLTTVTMGARPDNAGLRIWIEDDGIGIPADKIETALTRFAQVGAGEGTGLGLSIAEQIARSHGGRMDLHPTDNGLRVEICLPGLNSASV